MQIKIAPSLGEGFAGTPYEVWGVTEYTDVNEPCVFMGLYGLPDFYTLWRHKGKKYILWCGSDITNFVNGYWLDDEGHIRISPHPLVAWLNKNCESYVENEVEKNTLLSVGLKSKVVPSFLGNVNDYEICYTWSDKPKVYTSVSGDEFKLYGWDKISALANANENIEFHLYGNSVNPNIPAIYHNVIVHGRVPQEQMNQETKQMQGALRLTEMDGFSEIIAKSLLWGQYPISLIEYPHILRSDEIEFPKEPNIKGREWLLSVCNKFPWNTKS